MCPTVYRATDIRCQFVHGYTLVPLFRYIACLVGAHCLRLWLQTEHGIFLARRLNIALISLLEKKKKAAKP